MSEEITRSFSRGAGPDDEEDDDIPPPPPSSGCLTAISSTLTEPETDDESDCDDVDPRAPNVPRTPHPEYSKHHTSTTKHYSKENSSSTNSSDLSSIVHRAKSQKGGSKAELAHSHSAQRGVASAFCCCISRVLSSSRSSEPQNEEITTDSSDELMKRYCGRIVLPKPLAIDKGRKCLVLDLDETLVHSSFRQVGSASYVIPVTIEHTVHNIYVLKRPGVDDFLKTVSQHYEIIIYTASLNKYADPLLDQLDMSSVIRHRLFRESCTFHDGMYVKNLSLLGRDLSQTIIVDNSPVSYMFHPENAIGCYTWTDEMDDIELQEIADFLVLIKDVDDVRQHLKHWRQGAKYEPNRFA